MKETAVLRFPSKTARPVIKQCSASLERQKAVHLLDAFHLLKNSKVVSKENMKVRDEFLTCLETFKKHCESKEKVEEIRNISSIVKRNIKRFEPMAKNLDVELRVFCRTYNYYDGFEPAGTCRRSKASLDLH